MTRSAIRKIVPKLPPQAVTKNYFKNRTFHGSKSAAVKIVMGTEGYDGLQTSAKSDTIKNTLALIRAANLSQEPIYVGTHNKIVMKYCKGLNQKKDSNAIKIAHLGPSSSPVMDAIYLMMFSNKTPKNMVGPYVERRIGEAMQPEQSVFELIAQSSKLLNHKIYATLIQNIVTRPSVKKTVQFLMTVPVIKDIPAKVFSDMFLVKENHLIDRCKVHLQQGVRPWICAAQVEFIQPSNMGVLLKLVEDEYKIFQTLQASLTKAQQKEIIIALRIWLLPNKKEDIKDMMIQFIIRLNRLGYKTIIFDWEGP